MANGVDTNQMPHHVASDACSKLSVQILNPSHAEPGYTLPVQTVTVDPDQLAS